MKTQLNLRHTFKFAVILAILLGLASCASSYGGVRKCNGSRGQRVPMGVM